MGSIEADSDSKLIAVIDDDPFVLEAMDGLLRKWGYEVLTAATGGAALRELAERRRPPDLIVCDYHLPGGQNGIDVIGRLRGAFRIPAFLITADAAAAELVEAGGLDIEIMRKPADPKMLRAMVRQALRVRSRAQ